MTKSNRLEPSQKEEEDTAMEKQSTEATEASSLKWESGRIEKPGSGVTSKASFSRCSKRR